MERVGSDRVSAVDGRLVVESRADMQGWEVREFRRAAIVYRGGRWFVAAKERSGGGFRYTLEPWDDERTDIDGGTIDYDERYVAERDRARRGRAVAKTVHPVLLVLYPLIGLLPSAVKRRLADGWGISEERATAQSLVLEAVASLMILALLSISSVARSVGPAFGVDSIPWLRDIGRAGLVAVSLLVPDVVIRYSRMIGESAHPYGFWEWLFRREPRRPRS